LGFAGQVARPLVFGGIYRFLLGMDREPRLLRPESVADEFHDPFAALVLA
jgi:hypothetical protein